MFIIGMMILGGWSLYIHFSTDEYETDLIKIKQRKAAYIIMFSLVFLLLATALSSVWGFPGFLVVVLIFVIGGSITFYLDYDYKKAMDEMSKADCTRIGVQARDWDELNKLKEEHRNWEKWEGSGVSYEDVIRIEAHLQKMCDTFLPRFDGMPRVTAHLVNEPIHPAFGSPSFAYGGGSDIWVKKEHFDAVNYRDLAYTVKHEMTHCWIHWKGINEGDHGPEFHRKLNQML